MASSSMGPTRKSEKMVNGRWARWASMANQRVSADVHVRSNHRSEGNARGTATSSETKNNQ